MPIVLIPQILFSGTLVRYPDLAAPGKVLSWLVAGNWGVQAAGGASGVGQLLKASSQFEAQQRNTVVHSPFYANVWLAILCLTLIAAVCVGVTVWALRRKDIQEQLARMRPRAAVPAAVPEVRTA